MTGYEDNTYGAGLTPREDNAEHEAADQFAAETQRRITVAIKAATGQENSGEEAVEGEQYQRDMKSVKRGVYGLPMPPSVD